jgi:hypothetical protein
MADVVQALMSELKIMAALGKHLNIGKHNKKITTLLILVFKHRITHHGLPY